MAKNELTVIQFNGVVSNVNLQKQLTKINTAIVKSQKSSWEVATAVNNILTDELYADDFEKEQDFADFLGMSRPNLNKMKRAVDLKKNHKLSDDWTLTKAFEMLTIKDDEFDDFIESYAVLPSMTVAEIRDCVKCWNGAVIEEKVEEGEKPVGKEEPKENEKPVGKEEPAEVKEEVKYIDSDTMVENKEGKTRVSLYIEGHEICSDYEVTDDVLDKILTLLNVPHTI